MRPGSIAEVAARLKLWCTHGHSGLARVEWDSVYARGEVVLLLSVATRLVELEVPSSGSAFENATSLITRLAGLPAGSVASITGVEGIFPDTQKRLETLVALSFRREELASLPLKQIWWIPSHLSQQFVLGIPDLDSWFQLRLQLIEIPPPLHDHFEPLDGDDVSEARALARRFIERSAVARSRRTPISQIWSDLARPAFFDLMQAGLTSEASQILEAFSDIATSPEYEAVQRKAEDDGFEPSTAKAITEFAQALSATCNYSRARQWQEKLVTAHLRVLGEEHPSTLAAMNNLALTLNDQGDLAGARALQEQVLARIRRVLGGDHSNTLAAMSNLASTLRSQDDLLGAQELQEQVLAASRRTLGEDHPETLRAMNNLALTLNERGNLAGARDLLDQVLASSLRVWGEQNPSTLRTMNNLAKTLLDQGDLSAARALQERVLTASRRTLGDEHPDTLTAMNNLALTLYSQGDLAAARTLQERLLAISSRTLGKGHLNTLRAMNNLASTLHSQGDLAATRGLQEQALAGIRGLLGDEHPNTLTGMSNLARTLRSQGDLAGARALEDHVLAARSALTVSRG